LYLSPSTERALEHTPLDPQAGESIEHADSTHASSADGMFVALYEELRVLAERQLRRGGRELSLSATTLLHEAYIALGHSEARFPDRARFMGYVARAMRGLIIDYARRSRAVKRGGGAFEITLHPDAAPNMALADATELEGLGDALDELATVQPALAELVDLHFFAGLTFGEIATLRGVSERTAQRDWRKARLILHRTLIAES
jgi:RNA polymerase sigma factor (TIGR02999 family)